MSNALPVNTYIQYQNAPKFNALLTQLTNYLTIPIDQFYTDYFNLLTATTQGLDNWGIILNETRNITYYNYDSIFGFDTGVPATPDRLS